MPQARGSQAVISWYNEVTYNVIPATPAGQKLYVSTPFGLQASQNLLQPNTLTGSRERSEAVQGNINVSGPMNFELGAQSQGTIFRHAIGTNVTTGVGPYTHTMEIGDLPVGGIIQVDHGSNISGNRYERFHGVRVGSASLNFPQEGFPVATFNLLGANSTQATTTLDASLDDNGHSSFSAFQALIEEGGAPIAIVRSATIEWDNELDQDTYTIPDVVANAGIRRAAAEGFSTVSGSVVALFESDALITKAIAGTQSSLLIKLTRGTGDGSAGNEFMSFKANQLKYERTSPTIDRPGGREINLRFQAYKTVGGALTVVIKNAVAVI